MHWPIQDGADILVDHFLLSISGYLYILLADAQWGHFREFLGVSLLCVWLSKRNRAWSSFWQKGIEEVVLSDSCYSPVILHVVSCLCLWSPCMSHNNSHKTRNKLTKPHKVPHKFTKTYHHWELIKIILISKPYPFYKQQSIIFAQSLQKINLKINGFD